MSRINLLLRFGEYVGGDQERLIGFLSSWLATPWGDVAWLDTGDLNPMTSPVEKQLVSFLIIPARGRESRSEPKGASQNDALAAFAA